MAVEERETEKRKSRKSDTCWMEGGGSKRERERAGREKEREGE